MNDNPFDDPQPLTPLTPAQRQALAAKYAAARGQVQEVDLAAFEPQHLTPEERQLLAEKYEAARAGVDLMTFEPGQQRAPLPTDEAPSIGPLMVTYKFANRPNGEYRLADTVIKITNGQARIDVNSVLAVQAARQFGGRPVGGGQ